MPTTPKTIWSETPNPNTIRITCGRCAFTREVLTRAEGRRIMTHHTQREHTE